MVEIIPNWHPLFVHFTVALISVSGGLFVLTKLVTNWRVEDQWLATAYWSLWIGVLISLGTVAAGWYAFNTVDHDTPSHAAMLEHRNLALVTLVVLVIMGVWSLVQYLKERSPSLIFVACMLVSVGLVGSTAWHGGELVYRYGLGVKSLPKKEDHKHGHEAGASGEHGHDAAAPPAAEAAA
ncbi:MAG: hypothetical protein FD130_2016, partial [Halothiobacillaceae bacterium]